MMKKICTFRVKKNRLPEPKTEFGAQNQYGRVIHPSIRNFTWSKKKYTFGCQKGKNKASEPNSKEPRMQKMHA
jgi:hypothetical protein